MNCSGHALLIPIVLLFSLLCLGFLTVSAHFPKVAGKLFLVPLVFIAFSVATRLLLSGPTPSDPTPQRDIAPVFRIIAPEDFEEESFFVVVRNISSGKLRARIYRNRKEINKAAKESLDVPETGKDTFRKVVEKAAEYEKSYYKAGHYGYGSNNPKFSFEYKAWRDKDNVLEVQLGNRYIYSRYAVKNGKLIRVSARKPESWEH